MTINYLDKLYDKKLATKEMTRGWVHRLAMIAFKLKGTKDGK